MSEKDIQTITAMIAIIIENRDISDIFKIGVDIYKIPYILNSMVKKNYCIYKDGKYHITISGKNLLHQYGSPFTKKEKKVTSLFSRRIPRQSVDDIYLPAVPPNL